MEHKPLYGPLELNECQRQLNQHFALPAARVLLDPIMRNPEAMELAQDAVNTHLRMVVAWDEATGVFATTAPSEPIVADVAASVLTMDLTRQADEI